MSDPTPAPGWYPAPHANNEQRYWDGAQWLEPQPAAPTAVLTDAVPAAGAAPWASAASADAAAESKPTPVLSIVALIAGIIAFFTGIVPILGVILGLGAIALGVFALMKQQRKGLAVAGIVLGSIAVITSIAVTAGIAANLPASDKKPVAAVQQTSEPADEEVAEEPPATITVPDVVGLPVSDAITVLEDAGLDAPQLTSFEDPAALVVSTSRAAGSEATEGAAITIVVAEKPKLTLGQQNAIAKAQDYLDYSGFSRTGLIGQLEYEGFSTEDATFGADNAGADWNAEAAEKAADYLNYSSFSRQSLYEQLEYEGFQAAEIEYALSAVGY
ncbi:Ltp family lipoprotein [Microbacterium sp. EST19A]|uniref:Ltp family lipoprotein n=1 Tax=Microbacterium sp. EST19A TaxID=2862681 RepID=UPI001CBB37CB|nr:Ltp family lipoprotein [Microbacterium sp. EST19A]